MEANRSVTREAAEDIFFGQVVIIWARWFVIAAAAVFTFWTATSTSTVVAGTLSVVALMLVNFYLHARYMTQRPANRNLIILLSLVDLIIITGMIVVWPGSRGLESQFFVFYLPVVAAFGFVVSRTVETIYTVLACLIYVIGCTLVDSSIFSDAFAGGLTEGVDRLVVLVQRVAAIAAMGFLANFYFRILRDRRRSTINGLP